MYIPDAFRVDNLKTLHGMARQYPLGTLITAASSGLQVSPLPFLLAPSTGSQGVLSTHIPRANPQIDALREGGECLILFHGPNGYVSPSWYPSKQQHQRVAPTWNYAVVEVRGRSRVVDDQAWLREHLVALIASQEHRRTKPWSLDEAPADYVSRLLPAIAGIEIVIERIDGKFKLSQNRDPTDRDGVIAALESADDPHRHTDLAALMRKLAT